MYILCDNNPSQFNFDLGFGSRLFAWAQASKFADSKNLTIVLPSDEWIEHIMLDLPNTEVWDRNDINQHEWKNVVLEGEIDVSSSTYLRIDGTCNMKTYSPSKDDVEYLQTITFKESKLNEFFNRFNFDWGFHLRRWGGIKLRPESAIKVLNTLPNRNIKELYWNMILRCGFNKDPKEHDPSWICDQTYYQFLDMIVDHIGDKSTIYLSTDVPDDLCDYYLEQYPMMVSKIEYTDEWLDLFKEYYPVDSVTILTDHNTPTGFSQSPKTEWYKTTLKDVAIDLLDFFMLARSNMFLLSEYSQWGFAAKRYASAAEDNMFVISSSSSINDLGNLLGVDEIIESFEDLQLDELLE